MQTYKICSIAAICCGNIHHQTFNGKGYPRLKSNGTIQAPLGRDYADYQNHAPLSGTEIPTEALIVGLADRYDALRSRRPYKEAYSHEKTLAVLTKDDRSGINGGEWYGDEIWHVFEKHHLRFKEVGLWGGGIILPFFYAAALIFLSV